MTMYGNVHVWVVLQQSSQLHATSATACDVKLAKHGGSMSWRPVSDAQTMHCRGSKAKHGQHGHVRISQLTPILDRQCSLGSCVAGA